MENISIKDTGVQKVAARKTARTDYHVHPDYSIDAFPVKIRQYCCRAVELGLEEICFTTHLELDPVRLHIDNFVFFKGEKIPVRDWRWLDGYFREIQEAQREFRPAGLQVKAGLEVGYDLGLEREIEKVLRDYPFDYVLGAVHCLRHIAISSQRESHHYFSGRNLAQVQQDYFATLRSAVQTGFFHCLAHVDLYRRYGTRHFGSRILHIHRGAIEPILREMAAQGMGLEINTSSRRRGLKEFHPAREIISLAVEAGIRIFTVGSDAHRLEDLGSHIDEALALLAEFGLQNHIFTGGRAFPCGSARKRQADVGG